MNISIAAIRISEVAMWLDHSVKPSGIVIRQRRRQAFRGMLIAIESTSKLSEPSTVGAVALGMSNTGEEGRIWEPSVRR